MQITIFAYSGAGPDVLLYSPNICSAVKQLAGFFSNWQPSGHDESPANQNNSPDQPYLPKHSTRCLGRKVAIVRVITPKALLRGWGRTFEVTSND